MRFCFCSLPQDCQSAMYLTRIETDTNMRRYYQIDLAADLFGGVVLIRNWGRIGARGQQRRHWFADHEAAEQARHLHANRKLRRGYRAVTQDILTPN